MVILILPTDPYTSMSAGDLSKKAEEEEGMADRNAIPHLTLPGSAEEPVSTNVEEVHVLVEKKLPVWRMTALSAVGGAVDLGYAILGGYSAPLVVAAGLELQYASLALVISPLMGILFQVYLGPLSDKCQCRWGRRRPFIVLLSLTACLGMVFAPLAPRITTTASSVSSTELRSFLTVLGIILTVLFVLTVDFSVGALQLPSRAYLLDVIPTSQTQLGNFVYSVFIGLGALLGYLLGGINWSFVFGTPATIVNQAQIIFTIAIVLFLMSLLLTVCSVKEKQTAESISYDAPIPNASTSCCCRPFSRCATDLVTTMKDMLKFLFYMSKHMWLLWLTSVFGFLAIDVYLFFFTTFVGEVAYGGVSNSPLNSTLYQQYAEGVRVGSFGLAISHAVLTVISLGMNLLANRIGLKTLFMAVQYIYILCCFAMTLLHQLPAVLILGTSFGPYLGIFLTVPFSLIPLYKVSPVTVWGIYRLSQCP